MFLDTLDNRTPKLIESPREIIEEGFIFLLLPQTQTSQSDSALSAARSWLSLKTFSESNIYSNTGTIDLYAGISAEENVLYVVRVFFFRFLKICLT